MKNGGTRIQDRVLRPLLRPCKKQNKEHMHPLLGDFLAGTLGVDNAAIERLSSENFDVHVLLGSQRAHLGGVLALGGRRHGVLFYLVQWVDRISVLSALGVHADDNLAIAPSPEAFAPTRGLFQKRYRKVEITPWSRSVVGILL